MTTTAAPAVPHTDEARTGLVRTARVTGLLYLGVAVTGGLGFLFVRGQLFMEGDPAATLANLVANPGLARLGEPQEDGPAIPAEAAPGAGLRGPDDPPLWHLQQPGFIAAGPHQQGHQ